MTIVSLIPINSITYNGAPYGVPSQELPVNEG